MTRRLVVILALVVIAGVQAQQQTSKRGEDRRTGQPQSGSGAGASQAVKRYSPYAAAGGYSRERQGFWEFWMHRFNPTNANYGALIEHPVAPPKPPSQLDQYS